MAQIRRHGDGMTTLREMQEFAALEASTQRYIRRSLDVGLQRADAVKLWSRDPMEATAIVTQAIIYQMLDDIRLIIPEVPETIDLVDFYGPLIAISAFDLEQGRLTSFAGYRFLYERLIGARVRPWLPGAFAAAAMSPLLQPHNRRLLLASIPEAVATAPGWSIHEPSFYPEWVEKTSTV